jgi:(p)ppGpp synthase/HD superfamily hydrolase
MQEQQFDAPLRAAIEIENISELPLNPEWPVQLAEERFNSVRLELQEFTTQIAETYAPSENRAINDALTLMLSLHIDQTDRPDGTPYVRHTLGVARRIMQLIAKPSCDQIIAALLHDSVEDQSQKLEVLVVSEGESLTSQEKALSFLTARYGEHAAFLVSQLTNPDFDKLLNDLGVVKSDPNYKTRKNLLYAEHVEHAISHPDVLPIKLSDFIDNALSLGNLPTVLPEQQRRKENLVKKYLPVIKIFIAKLEETSLFPDIRLRLESTYTLLTHQESVA